MKEIFMTRGEILKFFEQGRLKEDHDWEDSIFICSIGDILDVCEAFKKRRIILSSEELKKRFYDFAEKDTSPVNRGSVCIIDLSQENLFSALFERQGVVINGFWIKAVNSNISPRRSLRYLTIRICEGSTWWSEDVFLQMEEYHDSLR